MAGIADVVDQQHAASLDLLLVEVTQRVVARRVTDEWSKQRRGPGNVSTAVEQAGDRMSEECAAGGRARYDLSRFENGAGQHVDQILREAPDRRRLPEELMWIEIHTAVIAVPEIEVPIEHQHFVVLQILERLLASLVLSIHVCKGSGVI